MRLKIKEIVGVVGSREEGRKERGVLNRNGSLAAGGEAEERQVTHPNLILL